MQKFGQGDDNTRRNYCTTRLVSSKRVSGALGGSKLQGRGQGQISVNVSSVLRLG